MSCGELHCDSVKIKTMINSNLFFLRQCESLDWSDCFVVLLLSATHFRKSGHKRLIRGCFTFSRCFQAGVFLFSLPTPSPLPLTHPISSSLQEVSTWHFRKQKHLRAQRKRLHCRLRIESRIEFPETDFLIILHRHTAVTQHSTVYSGKRLYARNKTN